jgi:CheY-like chemotaxis protein
LDPDLSTHDEPASPLQGVRVLVLEDEMVIRVMIEDLLGEFGCRVVGPAGSVAEALTLARSADIDVALLDLNLGDGETGYTVADVLAERQIPYAFVTGYSADVLKPPHIGRPVLEKPFWGESLATVLRRLVESAAKPEP